jgi:Flp pilus assembly protein TadD
MLAGVRATRAPVVAVVAVIAVVGGTAALFVAACRQPPPVAAAQSPSNDQLVAAGFDELARGAGRPGGAQAARQRFEQVLSRDPNEPRAVFGVGWASQVGGDAVTAETRYREASLLAERARLEDIRYYCRFNLGVLYRDGGHLDIAAAEFGEAAMIAERDAKLGDRAGEARLEQGRALSKLGRYPEALPALERAAGRLPKSGAVRFEKGLALWRSGRHDFAEIEFTEAVRLDPSLGAEVARARADSAPR